MPHATLVNASDLHSWAARRDSQSKLPQLLRHLVRSLTPNLQKLEFPSDESVQLGGWDGVVEATTSNDMVPSGLSVWELGVNSDSKGKADEDYDKRTNDSGEVDRSSTTFIFVTPRRWGGKAKWVTAKNKEGKWLKVCAYDAVDLETFLENAPAVHIWASMLLGKRPDGAIDLSNYWEEWASITQPQTSPSLVIADRKKAVDSISLWLQGQPSCLSLQAETFEDAVAFFAACVQLMPAEVRDVVLERSVVVEQETEWRRLSLCEQPLVLIPIFAERKLVASAIQRGHHVLLPLGLSEASSVADVTLGRPHRESVYKALVEMGIPKHQTEELATLGRRSLSALRRRLVVNPSLLTPKWAEPTEARAILPALLVGQWEETNEADQVVLSQLAGCDYGQVRNSLQRWANSPFPFIRRVGNTWLVISKEDSWLLLSRFLTYDDLTRLEAVALDVLGQANPKFELDVEERRMASIFGKELAQSGRLRAGIAETLALMAARSDVAPLEDTNTGQNWADRIVRQLFSHVTTWEHWASLDTLVVSLAEASPIHFLAAVDSILVGEHPIAVDLFDQEDSKWSGPQHTGLLWALELLAWSPDYIGRASLQLAQLTRLDFNGRAPGKYANRPHSSLREIFLSWHPSTMASAQQRLQILDQIRKREPDVAWNLMIRLLPFNDSVAHSTNEPDWRDWGSDTRPQIPRREIDSVTGEVVLRLCEDAGFSTLRWASLIPLLDDLQSEPYQVLTAKLRETVSSSTDEHNQELRDSLHKGLRELLARHMAYPNSNWSMPKERIESLRQVYDELEPQDLVKRYVWQFAYDSNFMLDAEPDEERDYDKRDKKIGEIRENSLKEIFATGGLSDIFRLVQWGGQPNIVGNILGQTVPLGAEEDNFLSRTLGSTESYEVQLGQGYIYGRSWADSNWRDTKLKGSLFPLWTSQQRSNFYLCLRCERNTWDLVKADGTEVESLYWNQIGVWLQGETSQEDLQLFIESVVSQGRWVDALHYLSALSYSTSKQDKLSPSFVMELLEKITDDHPEGIDWRGLADYIPRLLEFVEASGQIEDGRLGRLEWIFLPWLEHSSYRPKALQKGLVEDEAFFCELLKWAYKAENKEPRQLSAEDKNRAERAHDLLRMFNTIPGSDGQGNIDAQKLQDWTKRAIELARECHRGILGEQQIGQILCHSPVGSDGAWPHEAIRDVIEEAASEQMERGFSIGIVNNRGVTMRGLTDGGSQERELAENYRAYSRKFRDIWPRTSLLLAEMAERYERDALYEDVDADLTQDCWRA